MEEQDLPTAIDLFVDAFVNPPWNYEWMTTEKAGRYLRDLYYGAQFLGFVYEIDGEIAGVCLGNINDYFVETIYELKEIAISHTSQRKGIGSRLMESVESYLKGERGVSFITLQTARSSPVYDFYLANDFLVTYENASLIKSLEGTP
jgi:GNAT superfamily N-acetyltransferase